MNFRNRKKEIAAIAVGVAAIGIFNVGALASTTGSVTISGTTSGSYTATFGTIAFGSSTLGATPTTTGTLTAADTSGTGAGWNITMTSTAFYDSTSTTYLGTSGANDTFQVSAYPSLTGSGCTTPTNSGTGAVTYPFTIPQGTPSAPTAPTAAVGFIAAAGTGMGSCSGNVSYSLAIPANATPETSAYTSTVTTTISSGP